MQAFVPRSYLTPVRDEEAESQRKAKSRHARQTRRSTQGVTLTDLKEAHKTISLSAQDTQTEEGGADDRFCLTDERRVTASLKSTLTEIRPKWSQLDEQGNIEPWLQTLTESPTTNLSSCGLQHCNNSYQAGERWQTDKNHNPVEEAEHQQSYCDGTWCEHERLSRYDSSGETAADKPLGHISSYTRREARLASLSKQVQDSATKDYKKMYTDALHENERLKSRLQDSKQELVKIRCQLEKVTQRHNRISDRSAVLESEKREKQVLEKRVSDMEEDLKAVPALAQVQALRRVNECLLAENRAMLRALARLSETASMPETEDL
ncbi:protein phosphatase 1 regulatory subunit 12B [Betta splendens]|uniref:Protein phosphatase 1 regulatory subunit 12B n=1 Tax=Betta splendens TaxID=158456 RepID=A0A9W2XWU2_BETSP|nr:protein phosphatase 1 regulatory subunit 12B [Betta splendens]